MTLAHPPRRRLASVLPGLLAAALLATFAAPVAAADSSSPPRSSAEEAAERALVDGHDQARRSPADFGYGDLPTADTLRRAHDLDHVARNWSDHMAAADRLYHNPELTSDVCCWTSVGENIAWVQPIDFWGGPVPAAEQMMQGWMDSPGHRGNIMEAGFTQVGIGVTIDDDDRNRMWATAVFRTPTEDGIGERFTDVPGSHPFHDPIAWLVDEGITTGYGDDTFRPTDDVTRQAAAAFLHRLADEPQPTQPAPFTDVDSGHPFHDAIAWASEQGVVQGYDDGTFRPAADVTRQAFAAFLANHEFDGEVPRAETTGFTDVDEDHVFHDEIAWLVDEGIATGYEDDTFRPSQDVTRQAAAAFLHRYATG